MRTVFAGAFVALTSTVALAQVVAPSGSVGEAAVNGAATGGIQGAGHPDKSANPVKSGAAGATNGAAGGAVQGAIGGAVVGGPAGAAAGAAVGATNGAAHGGAAGAAQGITSGAASEQ